MIFERKHHIYKVKKSVLVSYLYYKVREDWFWKKLTTFSAGER